MSKPRFVLAGWLKGYSGPRVRADVIAGLAVAAVVAPQALAHAGIAGLPLQIGLYTAIVPMLAYALLGSSRPLSVSTTSTLAILTGTALAAAGAQSPEQLAVAASTLAFMSGGLLLLASLLRLGFLSDFISTPVLTGFKAGIGVTIVVSQLGKLLGIPLPKGGSLVENLNALLFSPARVNLPTLAISVLMLGLILGLQRWAPKVPAPLVAVVLGIGLAAAVGLDSYGVQLVGNVPSGLPGFALPQLSLVPKLWLPALGIALMSFTESIAAARSFAAADDADVDADRELLALGVSNAAGGFFSAMPAGGGTSQSAVNNRSGAATQGAEAVTAVVIVLVVLVLAPLLGLLPQATLGAIVLFAGLGLIKLGDFAAILRIRRMEFLWAVLAALGVMFLGTLQGIIIAVLLSFIALVWHASKAKLHEIGRDPYTGRLRTRVRVSDVVTIPGLLIVRPEGAMFFGNIGRFRDEIRTMIDARKDGVRVAIFDMRTVPDLEYTALKAFEAAQPKLEQDGREVWFAALQPAAEETISRTPLVHWRRFDTVEEAVEVYEKQVHIAC